MLFSEDFLAEVREVAGMLDWNAIEKLADICGVLRENAYQLRFVPRVERVCELGCPRRD